MNYQRVIPRDLFNESKLLKCIGRLCLKIHDDLAPKGLFFNYDDLDFKIRLDVSDNVLFILNLDFKLKKAKHHNIKFYTKYNSKENYPLYMECCYDETLVFDDNGEFTEEFINEIKLLQE